MTWNESPSFQRWGLYTQPSIRWKGCAGGAVRASASRETVNASNVAGKTRTIRLRLAVCSSYSERTESDEIREAASCKTNRGFERDIRVKGAKFQEQLSFPQKSSLP